MSNINSLLNSVPKLGAEKSDGTSTSYQDWKFAMSMVLCRADCWELMTKPKPITRDAIEEWEKKADVDEVDAWTNPRNCREDIPKDKAATTAAKDSAEFAIDEWSF